MTSNALRVVPVIDGVGEAGSTCICVNNNRVYLGHNDGSISCYKISTTQSVTIPTVELELCLDTGSKKAISQLSSVGSVLVALCNEAVYLFTGGSGPTVLVSKGALAVTVQEQSKLDNPKIAVSLIKRRILIFGKSFAQERQISLSSDVLKLVWFNQWIVGATVSSYISVDPETSTVRDVMPIDASSSMTILKSSNEILLTGQDGLGIFMNVSAEGLSPAPRNTISISHPDASICVLGQYLVCLSAQDGAVDVFSLTASSSNETKLIQTINLPSSGYVATMSFSVSVGIPVVAGSVLYLLITVPFESQLNKLVDTGKLEEALEFVNYQFPPGTERDLALKKFHQKVAWKLWNDSQFSVSFVHFSLSATEEDVRKLIAIQPCPAREPMGIFLRGFKSSPMCSDPFKKEIDLLLIELLESDELIELVLDFSWCVALPEARESLMSKCPIALALLLEKQGFFEEAIKLLVTNLPKSSRYLSEILGRHIEEVDDIGLTGKAVAGLVQAACPDVDFLIIRYKDPIQLLEILSSDKANAEVVRSVLWALSRTNTDALQRLLQQVVSEKKSEELEKIIIENNLKELNFDISTDFVFARMLLLANQGRVRDAFLLSPPDGERLIESLSLQTEKGKLVLLLAAVLFERNMTESAVGLIVRNEKLLSSSVRASELIKVVPDDLVMSEEFIVFLKRFNRHIQNKCRNSIVQEHQQSFKFLSTYTEWSDLRQTKPCVVNEGSVCSICSVRLGSGMIAMLPNGNTAHTDCLDAVSVKTSAQSQILQ